MTGTLSDEVAEYAATKMGHHLSVWLVVLTLSSVYHNLPVGEALRQTIGTYSFYLMLIESVFILILPFYYYTRYQTWGDGFGNST